MGLLSALGKIGKGVLKVGSFLPIPGANYMGKASDVLDAVGTAGDALGGGAAAAKDGRMDEATRQMMMDERNNRAQLEAATFNAGREGGLMRRALSARMLGDRQGPTDPRDKFGGGVVSDGQKELLAKYGGMADRDVTTGGYKVNPTMSAIPKSGAMEKIGGIAGTAGGLLGILGKIGGGSRDVPQNSGQATGAPNLPYQPLPRAEINLPSRQWNAGVQMPSGDPRLLARNQPQRRDDPRFPPLSGVNF